MRAAARCTFEVLLHEVWVGLLWRGAERAGVAGVALAVGAPHARPVPVTHILALRPDIDVVQCPGRGRHATQEEALVPAEAHRPGEVRVRVRVRMGMGMGKEIGVEE